METNVHTYNKEMALKVFIFLWMCFSTSNEAKLGECYSQYGANKQESIDWCDMVSKCKYFPETQLSGVVDTFGLCGSW